MPDPIWTADEAAWRRAAELVEWSTPFRAVWEPRDGRAAWFPGGRLNASVTCVDRHAAVDPDRIAITWEGEPGDRRVITYGELLDEVSTLARGLRSIGVKQGDVVALHLGLVPEAAVAMLACARIGAVHAVLPAPLPAEALADRLESLGASVLFTQDGAWRHGTVLPLKVRADEALTAVAGIEHTIVVRRTGMDVAWYEGDRWYHDLVAADRTRGRGARTGAPSPEPELGRAVGRAGGEPVDLPSDHPIYLISQAHRRGRPVVVTHGLANSLVTAAALHEWGVGEGERLWSAGDVSWLAVQTHGIYGPLARGGTTVLYEGTLDVPTHARAWEIMSRHRVTTMMTTPSVLRTMRGWAPALADTSRVESLRRVVLYAEPSEPELRRWAASDLGHHPVTVADGWGQVELGGICHLSQPLDPQLLPSVAPQIIDDAGSPVPDGEAGELVLTQGWAGEMLPGAGDVAAATDHHWTTRPGLYTTGDRVRRTPEGGLEFLGRTDEVVSLSGQLVSISEVRQTLLDHPFVERADVIERRDSQGGRFLAAAVVLDAATAAEQDLAAVARDLNETVRDNLGGVARPRMLVFVDRFGDELRGDERRRALAGLPLGDTPELKRITWAQVLAAADLPTP
ncbi:AMP-binding protein [Intrasporangium calvum]|uniref:acetate--CoA ligase n=1 Tax=Intrasporangium calvum TaxID=53358 RepID=A0ABT5GKX6_9MICO|nr:AMP-binding protein [Intrasporangium calvum]MDC5698878.1 AMP-binding protein [Intrasporangium calvum]